MESWKVGIFFGYRYRFFIIGIYMIVNILPVKITFQVVVIYMTHIVIIGHTMVIQKVSIFMVVVVVVINPC